MKGSQRWGSNKSAARFSYELRGQFGQNFSEHLSPLGEMSGFRPFRLVVADAITAWNENHSGWCNVMQMPSVMAGKRGDVEHR